MTFRELASSVMATCTDTFGEPVNYTPVAPGSDTVPVQGIFERETALIEAGADTSVQSYAPTFRVKLSDLPSAPAEGDVLEFDGESYAVDYKQEKSYDDVLLILRKTSS